MQGIQVLGAVFNLNGRAPYVHWHFFQMSAANLSVIGAMLIVFILAILLPFPGSGRARRTRRAPGGTLSGGASGEQRPGSGASQSGVSRHGADTGDTPGNPV